MRQIRCSKVQPDLRGPWPRLARQVERFCGEEDGTLTAFALMMTFWMIMVGGLAIDIMRYEQIRTNLQQTLDRSILAAASLNQQLNPEAVVRDYFAKAGIPDAIDHVSAPPSLNNRKVTAVAKVDVNPLFLDLSAYSIDNLVAGASGIAEQGVGNVEISLVLDVSRSMTEYDDNYGVTHVLPSPNRLDNLKTAAQEFVTAVLGATPHDTVTVSLVPYNAHVNLGPTLFSKFTTNDNFSMGDPRTDGTPASSFCIDLPLSAYNQSSIPTDTTLPQGAFFDAFSSTWPRDSTYVDVASEDEAKPRLRDGEFYLNAACQPMAENYVRVHQNNASVLNAHIGGLISMGGTAIDKGMKWGLALLDPDFNTALRAMAGANGIPAHAINRPSAFGDPNTMKVIVLMTDGENFEGEAIKAGYRGANLSPIWRSNGDGQLSIRHVDDRPTSAGSNQYWAPGYCNGQYVWNGRRWVWKECYTQGAWRSAPYDSGSGATQLTWAQVWENSRMQWVAWQLYARALGTSNSSRSYWFNTTMNNMRDRISVDDRNSSLQKLCTMAKNANVLVYGIAFEAPDNGQTQIRQCAMEGGYFEADGLEIRTAFRAIASQISKLRLTQ